MTLDAMKEAQDAKAWEDLHREDPNKSAAVDLLKMAVQVLEQAEKTLLRAADMVDGSPDCDRIVSLENGTEDIEICVRQQIGRMK